MKVTILRSELERIIRVQHEVHYKTGYIPNRVSLTFNMDKIRPVIVEGKPTDDVECDVVECSTAYLPMTSEAEELAIRWVEFQAGSPLKPSVLPPDGPAQVVASRVMELVCQKCKHDFDFCDCPSTCRRCGEPCGPSLECTGDQIAACQARRGLPTLKAGDP